MVSPRVRYLRWRKPFSSLNWSLPDGSPSSFLLSSSVVSTAFAARRCAGHAQMHWTWPLPSPDPQPGACPVGGRNETDGSERVRTSWGPMAGQPDGRYGVISGSDALLAGAAASRWDYDTGRGRRPVFQAEGVPSARTQQWARAQPDKGAENSLGWKQGLCRCMGGCITGALQRHAC